MVLTQRQITRKAISAVLSFLLVCGTLFFNCIPSSAHAFWEDLENYGMAYLAGSDNELTEAREKTIQLDRVINHEENKAIYTAVFNHGHESWTSPYEYIVLPSELTFSSIVSYEKTSGGNWTQTGDFQTLDSFSGTGKYKYAAPSSDYNKYFNQYTVNMWNADGSMSEINGWNEDGKFSHLLMWQTGSNSSAYKWVITMDIPENINANKSALIIGMCSWNGRWARGGVIGPHFAKDKYDAEGGTITKIVDDPLSNSEILDLAVSEAPASEITAKIIETGALPGGVLPKIGKRDVPVRILYSDSSSVIVNVRVIFLPKVSKNLSQVKFTVNGPTTVEDEFNLRIISAISSKEWTHYFHNTAVPGAEANCITHAGIVAFKGNASDFDMQTANAIINGGTADNYTCVETTYFQKETITSDAFFAAIIKVKHSTLQNDVSYICWIKYLDDEGVEQIAAYPAAQEVPLSSQYDSLVYRYIATYPYGG